MHRFGFPKSERLCGEIRISGVRQHGKRYVAWPLRAHVCAAEDGKTRVLVWAPKSLHKHAVDRNRIRRLMREAYRLNAAPLVAAEQAGKAWNIAVYNMGKEMPGYEAVEKAMKKLIRKIVEQ